MAGIYCGSYVYVVAGVIWGRIRITARPHVLFMTIQSKTYSLSMLNGGYSKLLVDSLFSACGLALDPPATSRVASKATFRMILNLALERVTERRFDAAK
jgi:hypothetical protein